MSYDMERRVAVESVIKACTLCQAVQSAHVAGGVIDKEDKSPVTVADFGAQAVVSDHLAAAFPHDPLVGEEDSSILRQPDHARLKEAVLSHVRMITPQLKEKETFAAIDRGNAEGGPQGRFWTLDPIDGTKGFLRGDQYAVALALIEDGNVVLGVLGCPSLPLRLRGPQGARGSLFVATRGQGATMRGLDRPLEQRIQVSDQRDPSQAVFCESFESSHSSHDDSFKVAELLQTKNPPLRVDSQCKYGILARGDAAIYLRLPTKKSYLETIWDHAAGSIIVQEAGGRVTDTRGKTLDFSKGRRLTSNKGVIASNGRFHEQILEAVQTVLGKGD